MRKQVKKQMLMDMNLNEDEKERLAKLELESEIQNYYMKLEFQLILRGICIYELQY